ncbi:MAG: LacI family DNA-binding transcriptional regulator [Pseudothermotoga sp.]
MKNKAENNSTNIKSVAQMAGVSISTVSRVINNPESVSEELRNKVRKAIEALGYQPNQIARSLRTGSTKLIGFIIPDITNPAFLLMVKGAQDFLKRKGYTFMVCGTDHNIREEVKLLKALLSQNVEGMIVTCSGGQNSDFSRIVNSTNVKMVFMDRRYEDLNVPYVGVDNTTGVEKITDYLIESGHRSLVYLSGERNTSSARERLRGFVNSVRRHAVVDFQILYGKFTFESGYELTKRLKEIPQAIVGGNDLVALGAIEALTQMGYSIPEDVSVVGFDDMFYSKYSKPSLTTVRQPIYEMGYTAGKILYQLLSKGNIKKTNTILQTDVVLRETVKPRNNNPKRG